MKFIGIILFIIVILCIVGIISFLLSFNSEDIAEDVTDPYKYYNLRLAIYDKTFKFIPANQDIVFSRVANNFNNLESGSKLVSRTKYVYKYVKTRNLLDIVDVLDNNESPPDGFLKYQIHPDFCIKLPVDSLVKFAQFLSMEDEIVGTLYNLKILKEPRNF